MKRFFRFVKRAFQIAYAPSTVPIGYKSGSKGVSVKVVLESLSALLALYAAYSDISQKVLDLIPMTLSSHSLAMARMLTGALGVFLCGHILFATESKGTVFAYSRIPRILAGIIIWLLIGGIVFSSIDFLRGNDPAVTGPPEASFVIPDQKWQLNQPPAGSATADRTYSTDIAVPVDTREKYRDLTISIIPQAGYKIVSASAKCERPLPTEQEPLRQEPSRADESKLLLPDFDESLGWKLTVEVAPTGAGPVAKVPFAAKVFLSK